MNETKKCSISGIAFTMEAEAYARLNGYIATLKERYAREKDGGEIIADIEARIAELILSTQDNGRVVERPLIENIIAQLGSAEAISEESDTDSPENRKTRIPRRFYRDMDNARLGGVCAGIAKYFGTDPTWIRLVPFVPVMLICLSWLVWLPLSDDFNINLLIMMVVGYMIMWFVVPAARSPRQKLEMNGEKITAQSIRDTAAAGDIDSNARPVVADTVTILGKVLIILLKIFTAAIIFGLTLFACALVVGLAAVGLSGGALFNDFGSIGGLLAASGSEVLIPMLGILVVLVPTVLLLYILICLLISRKPGRIAMLVMFLLWLLTIIALPVAALKASDNIEREMESASLTITAPDRGEGCEACEDAEGRKQIYVDIEQEGENRVHITAGERPKSIDRD